MLNLPKQVARVVYLLSLFRNDDKVKPVMLHCALHDQA